MNRIEELERERKSLWDLVEVSQQRLMAIREELQELNSKEIENIEITPEAYLNIMGAQIDQYGQAVYRRFKDWLVQFSGISSEGYNPETSQAWVSLAFYQTKPFEDQLDALKFVPFIKSNKLGIFEYTLSEGGVFHLEDINENPKLTITTYGITRVLKDFTTLMEALKYVYDHHPYERKRKSLEWERDNEW